uniref:Abasic site processing protein n=1 Tax=Schlesneria paludicola TaxID=360056 RepID=A0A7C2NT10_9PLAN
MCGRFNLRLSPGELQEFFSLFRVPEFPVRYNIAPTQEVVSIRHDDQSRRVAEFLKWGLVPQWAKDPSIGNRLLNARSESVAEKPAFRNAFRRRRCIVPASGYYEWPETKSQVKQPWHFYRKTGEPLALAGLWERWMSPTGQTLETCSLLTTEPNPFVAHWHDRMPVLLSDDQIDAWLDPSLTDVSALQRFLVPCPDDWLAADAVSTFVNSSRHEGPECLSPVAAERPLL